jgi:phage baseplate assembly protein W
MDTGRILGRGISFPPRVGADGRVAWSEGDENVRESVEVILKTELRERLRLPEFGGGLGSLLFEPNTTTTRRQVQDRIVKSLAAWEPRINVETVTVEAEGQDPQLAVATVVYRLIATQAQARVSLSLLLAA